MSQDQNWEDFQFEEPLGRLVSLPTAVMERICRLLDYKDQYESCLIHPNWSIAAMAILWEAPLFNRPDLFRKFLKTTSTCKRVALLVKRFHLAFVDIEEESLFKPLCRSSNERHHPKNAHPLAKASLIQDLARHCENMTDLVCYGWEMKPGDWEQIATVAHELKHLTVIGGSKQGEPKQIGVQVLSRLETLCLDGRFVINDSWAQTLIHKASNLRVLELSLENLDYDVFMKICQPGYFPLTKLTLTRASCLLDIHVAPILAGFPDLNSFCLEGTLSVSAATIMTCLESCAALEHLEIRANALSIEKSEKIQLETPPLDHILVLKSLLVENLNLTDSNLQMLSVWLPQLRTLGLKNCRLLTNQSLQYLVRNLTTIHLLDCPQLDSDFFSFLKHLRELYIKSCGTMTPNDIHNVCSQCDDLQSIKIIGHQELRDSMIDKYMEKTQEPRLVLNKSQIKTLAKTGLQYIPNERVLSGHHLLLLAQHLEMPIKDLDSLLDLIEQETMNAQVCNKEPLKNRLSRLEVLKSDNSSVIPRPNTPAIWSKDYHNQPNRSDTEEEEEEETNLGGWGLNQDTAKSWADIPKQVIDNIPTLEDIQLSTQVVKEPWRHQDTFLSPENKKPKAKPFFQDVQIKEDTSGWGYPGQVYDWNDYHNQGYAQDVIEQQKETVYYENGEKRNLQEGTSSFTNQPLFSSSTAELVPLFSLAEPMQRKQSMAVISSDEGPDWSNDSEEERIVVKVNDKTQKEIEPFYPKKRKADIMPKKNTSRQFSRPGRISPEVRGSAEDQWANIAKSNPERKRRPPRQKNTERKKDWRAESNEHFPEIPTLISLDDSQQVARARTFFPTDLNRVLVPERACTPKPEPVVDLMNEMMTDSTSEVTMKNLIGQENKGMLKEVTLKKLTAEEGGGGVKGFLKELTLEDLMMEEKNNKSQMTLEDVMTEIKSKEVKEVKRRVSVSSCSTDSMDWRDKEYDAMNTASWEYTAEENVVQSPQSSYDETDQCETPVDHLGLNKDMVDSSKIQTKVEKVLTKQLSYNTPTNSLPEFSSLMNDFSEKQSQSEQEQEPYYINDQVSSVSSMEPIRLQPNTTEDIMFESLMEEFSPSAQSTSSAEVNTSDNQTAIQTTNYNDTPQTVIDNPYDLTREYLKSNRRRLRYVTTVMARISEKENKCLHMFKDENLEVTIKKFCEKYNVQNIEGQLNIQLADIYKRNRTNLIMKKKI
ncbi:hypothetical protein G6F56_005551 [Rhizopus delemar]|nr:hypothetical protein G6F56_005551 [Rhizopus delemar]